ncbi:MAG: SRPBCC domain-containing protein [Burkholderiales bacterium]
MNTLHHSIAIRAPLPRVWDTMLSKPTYEQWTAAFCEGSTYEGSWETGASLRFLTPDGMGVSSTIAENRRYQRVSIRHRCEIRGGAEVTEGEGAHRWAGARETYEFRALDDGTEVTVEMRAPPEYEAFLRDTWPKALAILKTLCEDGMPLKAPDMASRRSAAG